MNGVLAGDVVPPRRASVRFMFAHPAHLIALGFGSGLAPKAPGTVGTLWAWVVFAMLERWLGEWQWGVVLLASLPIGVWACGHCARALGQADPSAIVWDEIWAFWLVLWLVTPAGFWAQLAAFGIFRLFDAAKPGPVGWADRLFKPHAGEPFGWRQAFGIVFDDVVAALCTLLIFALWRV
ncbi:MAG: phosphatidylglycerophosphatase A [Burkholderiaceae bacterium]